MNDTILMIYILATKRHHDFHVWLFHCVDRASFLTIPCFCIKNVNYDPVISVGTVIGLSTYMIVIIMRLHIEIYPRLPLIQNT